MYLIPMHSDRAQFEQVQCADLRTEAKLLLDAEAARLAAAQQPTQAAGAPAAPHATSPAPTDLNGNSPALGSSGVRKRPRGAAPAGMVWQDNGWVAASAARAVPGPSPATAANRRGRPRKSGFRGSKRKPDAPAAADENCASPQQQPAPRAGSSAAPPGAKRARRGLRSA